MPQNEYTPSEALNLLMQKLRSKNEALADIIQAAIDAGKDLEISEPKSRGRGRRFFRKTEPLSHIEALEMGLHALESYFVEQPFFANSVIESFIHTTIGPHEKDSWQATMFRKKPEHVPFEGEDNPKIIEIE